jgi:hypothetical protein
VKYLLSELEADVSGTARDWETDPASIEHVLPENPTEAWDESFKPERQKDFIYRLGNLLLLEPSLNRQCQNGNFDEKRALYLRSHYASAQAMGREDQADWSPAALGQRQERMARRAAHIWRSDFV